MKIGVVGLGSIAQKAYLPVLLSRSDIEVHFMGRSSDKVNAIADTYRVHHRCTSLQKLVSSGIQGAFVHASTDSHYEIVKLLLESGVHVFVDKPITEHLKNTEELVDLARQMKRSLMVGFNRRYSPAYRAVVDAVKPQFILMQKNRKANVVGNTRTMIYDDFIHVIDTLRFLLNSRITEMDVQWEKYREGISYVAVRLSTEANHAVGIMHRNCGADEEILEVMSSGVKYHVHNVRETTKYEESIHIEAPNAWSTTYAERGFQAMVEQFIHIVRSNEVISADDAVETHKICEEIIGMIESS